MALTGVEARVCEDIAKRQELGVKKYGMTLEQNQAGLIERLQHAYEECLDQALYLKWAIESLRGPVSAVAKPIEAHSLWASHDGRGMPRLLNGGDLVEAVVAVPTSAAHPLGEATLMAAASSLRWMDVIRWRRP